MDICFGYNQIHMFKPNKNKTEFMIDKYKYQYNVIPFRLTNSSVTYQRMINKVFLKDICETLEVYMGDMVVKSSQEESHDQHL